MNKTDRIVTVATRRQIVAGLAFAFGTSALVARKSQAQTTNEISRTMESIHQEIDFKASPDRVYAALTEAKLFQKAMLLSDAVKTGMVKAPGVAQISPVAGGEFALFGGYITGRQIELVQNVRIVQAWRTARWESGRYSIAKFALAARGSGTLLSFDHIGFPKGEAEQLAAGWRANYWQPLEKVLT